MPLVRCCPSSGWLVVRPLARDRAPKEGALLGEMALLGVLRRGAAWRRVQGRFLAQGLLAGRGLVERLAQESHLGFRVAEQAGRLLLLRVHLDLHGRHRLSEEARALSSATRE